MSIKLHSLGPERKWAYGDWVISRVGYAGDDFAALYGQVRKPIKSERPVEHYLMVPGHKPFRWESPLYDDSRDKVVSILFACQVQENRSPAQGPELMGTKEVAAELGVTMSNLNQVVGLPEPHQVLLGGRIWLADVIREFAVQRRSRIAA